METEPSVTRRLRSAPPPVPVPQYSDEPGYAERD
jgi:hypothetical protein